MPSGKLLALVRMDGTDAELLGDMGRLRTKICWADTSYAGVATIDADHSLLSWYSGNLQKDEAWVTAMFDITDIWQGTLDFTKLP